MLKIFRVLKSHYKFPALVNTHRFKFSQIPDSHKYSKKTSKQIDQEILKQKYQAFQNTYKSLSTSFGLKKPTLQQLEKTKDYPKPKTILYDLQTLRVCSKQFPIYLYNQLRNKSSPFHEVIDKVLQNLWKAQKKETLEMIQFLLEWRYKGVDILQLYISTIERENQIDCFDFFTILRKFYRSKNQIPIQEQQIPNFDKKIVMLVQAIQVKLLQKLRDNRISQEQYGPLIKIISLMNVNQIISEQFYFAVTQAISVNINSISPKNALNAYVFFTYNQADISTPFKLQSITLVKKQLQPMETIVSKLLEVIQKRVMAEECIKFYNSQEIVALMHTFLKNSILRGIDNNLSEENPDRIYFEKMLDKIINRIQLMWATEQFKLTDKQILLKLCQSLTTLKKQKIIALFHARFLNQAQKFQKQILTELYLISYESNMLTPEISRKLQNRIVEELFSLSKEDVSRAAWLFVVTGAQNMDNFYKKIEDIVFGGLANKGYEVKEVAVIVWALGSTQITDSMLKKKKITLEKYNNFWINIEQYLFSQLQKKYQSCNKQLLPAEQVISDCSWILWSYLNNQELSLKTIDLLSQLIIEFMTPGFNNRKEIILTPFELSNITSFYYSVNYPKQFEKVVKQVQIICYEQFIKIYSTMECAQICRVLKYIHHEIWKNEEVSRGLLEIFRVQCNEMNYPDVLSTLGLLMEITSPEKQKLGLKLMKLILKLNERRQRLIAVESSQNSS